MKVIRHSSLIMILVLTFAAASYAQTTVQPMPLFKNSVPKETLKQYPVLPYKFIDLIKAIPKPLPASLEKFQKIFNNKFSVIKKMGLILDIR